MTTNQPLSLFISSKMDELAPERRAVQAALSQYRMYGWIWEDDAGARPQTIRKTFLTEVAVCDIYIGLFWLGYGQYTVEEYEYARQQDKPCLIYEKRVDLHRRSPKLKTFLDRIQQINDPDNLTVSRFETPEQLAEQVQKHVIWLLTTRFRGSRQQLAQQSTIKHGTTVSINPEKGSIGIYENSGPINLTNNFRSDDK